MVLTDEAPTAIDLSASPPVSQRSSILAHPVSEEENALPTFENSNRVLEYLLRKDAHLEKQCKIERLWTWVLGKITHQQGASLDALAMPLPSKQMVFAELPTRRVTVLLPDNAGQKQKDYMVYIYNTETLLEFDATVYLTESYKVLFAKQYLVGNTAAT